MNSNKPSAEDDDMYYEGGGYVVFTAEYLLKRGYCCGNGCRHCPYDYKAAPEPQRTYYRERRKAEDGKTPNR